MTLERLYMQSTENDMKSYTIKSQYSLKTLPCCRTCFVLPFFAVFDTLFLHMAHCFFFIASPLNSSTFVLTFMSDIIWCRKATWILKQGCSNHDCKFQVDNITKQLQVHYSIAKLTDGIHAVSSTVPILQEWGPFGSVSNQRQGKNSSCHS